MNQTQMAVMRDPDTHTEVHQSDGITRNTG